jgi:hypothetical protein
MRHRRPEHNPDDATTSLNVYCNSGTRRSALRSPVAEATCGYAEPQRRQGGRRGNVQDRRDVWCGHRDGSADQGGDGGGGVSGQDMTLLENIRIMALSIALAAIGTAVCYTVMQLLP